MVSSRDHKSGNTVLILICLLGAGAQNAARAQGLAPTVPVKEFLYFGGRLVAVEERGTGNQPNAVGKPNNPASTAQTSGSKTSGSKTPGSKLTSQDGSATGAPTGSANSAAAPTLPVPGVPPQDTSPSAAPLPAVTPDSTHTTATAAPSPAPQQP